MIFEIAPEDVALMIAVLTYADDIAADTGNVAMQRALADLRATRTELLLAWLTWLKTKPAAASESHP